jgi:ligand-binding SRPBCC domain-containing protein
LGSKLFRQVGGRLLPRAKEAAALPPDLTVFVHRSIVPGSAADVFRWHERPDSLYELIPSRRWVRVDGRTGSLRDGTVVFSVGAGPLRLIWEARHYGYVPGIQFCDEQVRGPFKTWRHTHRVEAVDSHRCVYEDRVEYAMRGGPLVRWLAGGLLRQLLTRAFAERHRVVHARFAGQSPPALASGRPGVP